MIVDFDLDLDKGKSRSWSKWFHLMFNLVLQVLLHAFLFKDLLLQVHGEEDAG